jgi:hypothetical protein
MVGAMVLARAVFGSNPDLSAEILEATNQQAGEELVAPHH